MVDKTLDEKIKEDGIKKFQHKHNPLHFYCDLINEARVPEKPAKVLSIIYERTIYSLITKYIYKPKAYKIPVKIIKEDEK